MPTFSIIIPAYNAEAFLPKCLDSIFSQEFDDYEVIVVNDGSTDETAVLLEGYASKHHKLQVLTQINQGMATARNRGMEVAHGDYILFVDSDDSLCPNALATLAPHLNGEDIIGFGIQICNENIGIYTDNPIQPTTTMSGWDYFNLYRLKSTPVHFVCIWQRVYQRGFLEKNSLRFAEGLKRAEDDLFTTMAFLLAQRVKAISSCLYSYTVRQGSITRSCDPKLDADSWRVQQALVDTFIPMQGIDKTVIYRVLASNYINHLTTKGNYLTKAEWKQFREVCITPRHRRLYSIARISPALLRLYNHLCSSLR